ncbi:MAG: efflux RND transporter periplasmic adaptor subunit [Desulfobacteraceae bacterium]|nr:efflux RND transporter periplasmic adaptor subunit [Desulfobacteraceae bacterium]MBC2754706.1 efflux RND transporter periplasmic adaptor subunit [Desulfobacteraceae bacterium]
MNQKLKTTFPFWTVILTAIITLVLFAGLGYYFGYLDPRPKHAMNTAGIAGDLEETTLYSCGMHPMIISDEPGYCPLCEMALTPIRKNNEADNNNGERRIAYWRAPMNSMEIYDKPGKSAMGMDLVPVYEDALSGGVEISIDPVTRQNMGLRTAIVETGPLDHTIRTYGHITYDETRMAQINLKFSGWIEKLYVDFTGQIVEKGQPLFDVYSPELITAQEDYLEAYRNQLRNPNPVNKKMMSSVRRRLGFFDIGNNEIRAIEKQGMAKQALTIRSSFKGVVTVNNAVNGGYIKTGTIVYTIADLSRVWVEAHIYEYELAQVVSGQKAVMTLPYQPGKEYEGKVTYVYPYLQQKTRDVVIRLEFDNPDLELKPEMYANVKIHTSAGKQGTQIPSESVLRSGERNIVFVSRGDGKYIPREVTLGMYLNEGKVHVMKGLAPGEIIVTSGQFLLDSESKLKEATRKMMEVNNPAEKPKTKKTDAGSSKEQEQDDFFDDLE